MSLHLLAAEPTVFFVERNNRLYNVAEVLVENTSEPVEAVLGVEMASGRQFMEPSLVVKGKSTHHVHVPESDQPAPAEFMLQVHGELKARHHTTWQPKRQWEVYLVPITHHDIGYTNTAEDVLHEYLDFYEKVLRFCEETADWPEASRYRYTIEAAWSLQHFVRKGPRENIEKLRKFIKEGRIDVPALFGNQISTLCGHEELIRLLYPSFRMQELLGGAIRSASITDVPGLSWALPTVLASVGVRYFFAGLPTYYEWGRNDVHSFWDEKAILRHGRPDAFRWEGPDGGSVLVYYQGGYGQLSKETGPDSVAEIMEHLPGALEAMEQQGSPFRAARYIHNGVDNYPPDIQISHIVRDWNKRWAYPKLIVATNTMFFEALEQQCEGVRVFHGELPDTDYVVGATTTAKETSLNRGTHDHLLFSEKIATMASLLGVYPRDPEKGVWVREFGYYPDPAQKIDEAYQSMLLYDEHTWSMARPAGRLHEWNWSTKSHLAYKAAGLVESISKGATQAIAEAIHREAEGRHIVVFNSLSLQRTDVVRLAGLQEEQPFDLIDETTGKKVPYQIVELDDPHAAVPDSADRYSRGQFDRSELLELVFVAEAVPSMGWKTYRLAPRDKPVSFTTDLKVGEDSLENRFFKLVVDPRTGAVRSIYDKELSREIVDPGAIHGLNQFVARHTLDAKEADPTGVRLRQGLTGPVAGSLVVSSEGVGCPRITQEITLYDNIKRIDLSNRILKDSTSSWRIYFAFPFKMDHPRFRFEGCHSVIEPVRDQLPGSNSNYHAVQHWADVSDGEVGVTLCPRDSHLLEFGGLWPSYVSQAHHGVTSLDFGSEFVRADQLTKGHMYAYVLDNNFQTNFPSVQCGDLLFRYSINTHEGGWKEGRPRDFGWAIANPLVPMMTDGKKKGKLGMDSSFCQLDPPNVFLLTLKQAEDKNGMIVRLIETEGKAEEVTLTFPHLTIKEAHETDLVEINAKKLAFTSHAITAHIKPFGITTILFSTDHS